MGAADDWVVVASPLQGTVAEVTVAVGDPVGPTTTVVVVESMKMEHAVPAGSAGTVTAVAVEPGQAVAKGAALVALGPGQPVGRPASSTQPEELAEAPRGELEELYRRRLLLHDEARPEAMARRRSAGRRSARENVADLCDPGSFSEYGGLAIAAQRRRRDLDELVARTPADGLVAGTGTVNAGLFGAEAARCAVLAYDFTVLAGTQGQTSHRKADRLLELAAAWSLPVVLFAEGGGGRPGDSDTAVATGLDTMAFALFGRLSGRVPLIGVVAGRCFAGNAALLGTCDVVVATEGSNVGMGGPAMIEGAGLGAVAPEDIGPLSTQVRNGVVDVAVPDEAQAVDVARRVLAWFQGDVGAGEAPDQTALRRALPADRRRAYDVRALLRTLVDHGSLIELKAGYAPSMVTALGRLGGRAVGVLANDPKELAGAIDAPACEKAAWLLRICGAFGRPVVSVCDTPGFMVGPEAERGGLVRAAGRLFAAGASLEAPLVTVVTRRGYGLGAQAMAGGSFRRPVLTVAWPTGELGAMGLEGAVRLGFRRELEAAGTEAERQALYEDLVARAYAGGRALNVATYFEIDDVVDPAETRGRLLGALAATGPRGGRR